MRKNKVGSQYNDFSILALDDDQIMTLTLQSYFQASGYHVDVENDPTRAIERIRGGHYDILLLDFLMSPICGDEVVAQIRAFNKELFIILLTGHKSLAPPIRTIRELDIQGYYEKSDRFDQLELLVESCVKSIRQMRMVRAYRDGLQHLADANPELYRLQPIEKLLQTVFSQLGHIFGKLEGFCYLDGADSYFYATPFYEKELPFAKKKYEEIAVSGLKSTSAYQGKTAALYPLVDEKQAVFGVLALDFVHQGEQDNRLLEIYIHQVSAAIGNVVLNQVISTKNEELEKAYAQLHKNYSEMVSTVRFLVDARDIYTCGHSDRVSYYATLIAERMGMDEDFQKRIKVAGLFHDIGKISVPDNILLKDSKLTDEEYEQIKKHARYGYDILSALSAFTEIVPIILSHHERIDGRGYPDGMSGEEIPLESRIIGVVDAFDAMTSHRRYRANMNLEQARQQLIDGKGSQFDAAIVDIFLEILESYEHIKEQLAWTYTERKDEQLEPGEVPHE